MTKQHNCEARHLVPYVHGLVIKDGYLVHHGVPVTKINHCPWCGAVLKKEAK